MSEPIDWDKIPPSELEFSHNRGLTIKAVVVDESDPRNGVIVWVVDRTGELIHSYCELLHQTIRRKPPRLKLTRYLVVHKTRDAHEFYTEVCLSEPAPRFKGHGVIEIDIDIAEGDAVCVKAHSKQSSSDS